MFQVSLKRGSTVYNTQHAQVGCSPDHLQNEVEQISNASSSTYGKDPSSEDA